MVVAGETTDVRLPWIGGGLIVFGALALLAAWRLKRRGWSY